MNLYKDDTTVSRKEGISGDLLLYLTRETLHSDRGATSPGTIWCSLSYTPQEVRTRSY